MKKYCVNLLENLGSFKYTRDILESLDRQARDEVSNMIRISLNSVDYI